MSGRLIFGLILLAIGLSALTNIPVFSFVFGVIVILIGIRVLSGRDHKWGYDWEEVKKVNQDDLDEILVFSGARKTVLSDKFEGGRIVTVFGGGEYDLTKVKLNVKELNLEVTAVFGGLKLKLPKNWNLKINSTAILGGINNKTQSLDSKPVLVRLVGTAVFGGIELVN